MRRRGETRREFAILRTRLDQVTVAAERRLDLKIFSAAPRCFGCTRGMGSVCGLPGAAQQRCWRFIARHVLEAEVAKMSTSDTMVPFRVAPVRPSPDRGFELMRGPGLSRAAVADLEYSYPGTLTDEMRSLLQTTCGFAVRELGALDLTGRWHPAEPMDIFHPCLTLAIDHAGRRWIAETYRGKGLPGPVWCIQREPAVAIHVSEDLGNFLDAIRDAKRSGGLTEWFRNMRQQAWTVWARRQSLARESYQSCRQDRGLRGWLAELPLGSYIYDLRAPSGVRGWPYGVRGPSAELHRCGRLPLFAVSAAAPASRCVEHEAHVAATGHIPSPAITRMPAAA